MTDPNVVMAAAAVATGMVGYVVGWASHPKHRKGCGECDAALRRAAEAQLALQHDAAHKGWHFKDTDPDQFNCADASCRRNNADGR